MSTLDRLLVCPPTAIPATHRDLVLRHLNARLTTLMPDGYPQTHPVWFNWEEPYVCINTMRGFRKERNMRADPRVTVLLVDPQDSTLWLEIRGTVQLIDEGSERHLDLLARLYTGADRYFGPVVPAELRQREVPVKGRITPVRLITSTEANAQSGRHCKLTAPLVTVAQFDDRVIPIPASHRDLLERPLIAALSTLMPGGQPQTQPVWCDIEDGMICINTTRERRKGRNLEADPRASVLVIDPDDDTRWIEVRGDMEVTTVGALSHLERLTRLYTGQPNYYGAVVPNDWRIGETRITCKLRPRHIVRDAIHASSVR
jgi:PPOX class probable F420-dependent enzyme